MSKYTFEQIKETVLKWGQNNIAEQLTGVDYVEITKNEEEVLLIDLSFNFCLAQIVVSKPIFAPYQYVSFETMTMESKRVQEIGEPEMVYFFYDSEDMPEDDVLDELNFGVKLCSQYIPNQLKEMYLNRKGTLIIKNKTLYNKIHSDDVKKYNEDMVLGDFVCTGIESQYLVVKSELISLRVLPQLFTIK